MWYPSFSFVLSGVFIAYILYSISTLAQLFIAPSCKGDIKNCFSSYLNSEPPLQLLLYTSSISNPLQHEVNLIHSISKFSYREPFEKELNLIIPPKTINNGSLYLHVVLAGPNKDWKWPELQRDGPTVIRRIKLTKYALPQAATFNLLGETKHGKASTNKRKVIKPVAHFKSRLTFTLLTDNLLIPFNEVPQELARYFRVNKKNEFLPIIEYDFLRSRIRDLVELNKNTTSLPLHLSYSPISIGTLRLLMHVEGAMFSLKTLGFTDKDVDEVKGIFADTNVYLLCGTVFIGSIHLLFDFLAFKNDISFWRERRSMAGLSTRTVLWRAFSQIVIFLFLLDENTSLIVLIPSGIGTLIEMWKAKKILRITLSFSGFKINSVASNEEKKTEEVDAQAMRYLSYLLYPLCLCGAVYSLLYQPHKSWYSWSINSLVNGVYAFGFLFMLPQLFVNYKLRSVAALPWRAFMYKAFNTFIDDVFAFIITMPTAHRVACFRDDIVFVIYLYQRWLYPVDKTRVEEGVPIMESDESADNAQSVTEEKKTK